MNRPSLRQLRSRIDRLDRQLLRLLNQRAQLAVRVGALKRQRRQPMYDPEREQLVLRQVTHANHGPFSSRALLRIFHAILRESRRLEISTIK